MKDKAHLIWYFNIIIKISFLYKYIILLLIFNLNIINIKKKFIVNENLNYENNFVIFIKKVKISTAGLLAYYYTYLGCVHEYILKGYIPIMDLISHPNIFNGFNTNITRNPWEEFFFQPYKYTLENVKKYAKNIKYIECYIGNKGPNFKIFKNIILKKFWHNFAYKYIPIKDEIIKESNKYFKLLFKNKKNILGVLMRGTDYISKKPYHHAKQPTVEMVFKDIERIEKKINYDYIFITTEDDLIREKFINKYGKKLKYIKSKTNINYDYKKKQLLAFNKNICGNLHYMKIYLINILILSKSLDIIASKTAGSMVAFILNEEFRNKKVYDIGYYK